MREDSPKQSIEPGSRCSRGTARASAAPPPTHSILDLLHGLRHRRHRFSRDRGVQESPRRWRRSAWIARPTAHRCCNCSTLPAMREELARSTAEASKAKLFGVINQMVLLPQPAAAVVAGAGKSPAGSMRLPLKCFPLSPERLTGRRVLIVPRPIGRKTTKAPWSGRSYAEPDRAASVVGGAMPDNHQSVAP